MDRSLWFARCSPCFLSAAGCGPLAMVAEERSTTQAHKKHRWSSILSSSYYFVVVPIVLCDTMACTTLWYHVLIFNFLFDKMFLCFYYSISWFFPALYVYSPYWFFNSLSLACFYCSLPHTCFICFYCFVRLLDVGLLFLSLKQLEDAFSSCCLTCYGGANKMG